MRRQYRLRVFRSNKYIYAQIIDEKKDLTVTTLSCRSLKLTEKKTKREKAKILGGDLAKKLIALKIKELVFDRGRYKYLGRVRQLAEGVREGGIKI